MFEKFSWKAPLTTIVTPNPVRISTVDDNGDPDSVRFQVMTSGTSKLQNIPHSTVIFKSPRGVSFGQDGTIYLFDGLKRLDEKAIPTHRRDEFERLRAVDRGYGYYKADIIESKRSGLSSLGHSAVGFSQVNQQETTGGKRSDRDSEESELPVSKYGRVSQ